MRQLNEAMRQLFMQPNEAMTKWWFKLSAAVVVSSLLLPYMGACINFAKGVAAGSSLCIFIGYYLFAIIYGIHHKPNLVRQLYTVQGLQSYMSFPMYVAIDISIHVGCTTLVYFVWYKHITLATSLCAYCFHREWSLVNSERQTMFLHGDIIYQNKAMPTWVWSVIYGGEGMVLILSTALAIWLQ
jgi:hypothetical protein